MARIPNFLVQADRIGEHRVEFPPAELHHVVDVLRLGPGDRVRVLDGSGTVYECVLRRSSKKLYGEILSQIRSCRTLSSMTVAIGLLKVDRFDWLIEKMTELQVDRIAPLLSAHSRHGAANRLQRWRRVAVAACKQSGNAFVPQIDSPIEFGEFIRTNRPPNRWIFLEKGGDLPPFGQLHRAGPTALLVGPEGGWDEEEITLALTTGFAGITLPGTVLRAETGAVVAVSLARSWLDWYKN